MGNFFVVRYVGENRYPDIKVVNGARENSHIEIVYYQGVAEKLVLLIKDFAV